MINLIKADLYKETRKKSFLLICILIIFVSILYVCLINKNGIKEEKNNIYPAMTMEEYKSINSNGNYSNYLNKYNSYKINANTKETNSLGEILLLKSSSLLYIIGLIIIFKSFHSLAYDFNNKTIRYIFQSNHSRKEILLSKIISLIIIAIIMFIILSTSLLFIISILSKENIFFLLINYLKYYIFFIPIVFMIIFTLLLTTIFSGSTLALILSFFIYLFSLTIFNISLSYNITFLQNTFIPYLDMSYYLDINQYYLNNIIFNINTTINKGIILLIVYGSFLVFLNILILRRDIN